MFVLLQIGMTSVRLMLIHIEAVIHVQPSSWCATVGCLSSESLPTTATNLYYANIARITTKVDKNMQAGLKQ